MEDFIVEAEGREDQGKGASRRLRRTGKVPGIIYGGKGEPVNIQMPENELAHHLESEAFFSHVLTIKVGKKSEKAVLKDVQRHPSKPKLLHVDFLRIVKGQDIKMQVPLHFIGEDEAPAVKQGGVVQHQLNEVEVICPPEKLPEYIEVDVSALELDESIHLSNLTLPKGVALTALQHEDDATVAVAHKARVQVEEDETTDAAGDAAESGDDAAAEDGGDES